MGGDFIMKMGKNSKKWMENYDIQYITICVTEDCNMNCSYCYYVNKNNKKKLSLKTGKDIIDYILTDKTFSDKEGVHIEFIGGEPSLEIQLIQDLCDYMVMQMIKSNHRWLERYIFFMTTNGLKYTHEKFQNLLNRHKGHISVVISIDGIREKHDLSRLAKNGEGTFDHVSKVLPLWRKQFPGSSNKATFSHGDIKFLKDSIIFLWSLGIKDVNANIVFEDVWEDGDTIIYREQLYALANYVLENNLYEDYSVTFFSSNLGHPLPYNSLDTNVCGVGMSIAIDSDGNILPCHRFFECALDRKGYENAVLGDIYSGLNIDKLRAFNCLSYKYVRDDKCKGCQVATGCSWCIANNYSESKCDSLYVSVCHKCEMHKINAEVNKYLWEKIQSKQQKGCYIDYFMTKLLLTGEDTKYLYILTGKNMPRYCQYNNDYDNGAVMSSYILDIAEQFCINNNFIPVIVGDMEIDYPHYAIRKNVSNDTPFQVIVAEDKDCNVFEVEIGTLIYNVDTNSVKYLSESVVELLRHVQRINILISDMSVWSENECTEYKKQLISLSEELILLRKNNIIKSINVLDDIMYRVDHFGCGVGENSFALAPNGKIYLCPAFYFDDINNSIGSLEDKVLNYNQQLFTMEKAVLCKECDNFQCLRCAFINKQMTGQVNISPEIQCRIRSTERNIAKDYQKKLISIGQNQFANVIESYYDDPIQRIYFRNRYLKKKRKI